MTPRRALKLIYQRSAPSRGRSLMSTIALFTDNSEDAQVSVLGHDSIEFLFIFVVFLRLRRIIFRRRWLLLLLLVPVLVSWHPVTGRRLLRAGPSRTSLAIIASCLLTNHNTWSKNSEERRHRMGAPKLPISLGGSKHPPNTWFLGSTKVHTTNCMST